MTINRKAYLVGGGIGSLAAAAFMIRDGDMAGENITIFEALPLLGGSLDAAGNAEDGYSMRGGRMLTTDNYECTWDLFKTIPTLTDRPLPVPKNSRNLALVSQFVEVPDDVVFTVEYSVRAAQMAVYQLLEIDREIPQISHHDKSLKVNIDAVIKAFK